MRDILLCVLLFGGLPVAFARPFYGALVFTWLGLMNPHRFTWGVAYDMPWSLMYAAAIMGGLLFVADKRVLDSLRRYWPVVLYVIWMGVTTLNAVSETAGYRYQQVLKVHVMCVVTLALLTTRKRILWFSAVLIGSIAFFGVKGGIFTILGGGQFLVWGPPETAIQDNNHLAAGLVVILPLLLWAYTAVRHRVAKLALIATPLLVAVSILGSHSRGAFLALTAMAMVLVIKGKHKLTLITLAAIVAAVALILMPEKYWERIDTINTYQEDASAMGRINTWIAAFNIANARLTGAGYEYYGSWLYRAHSPNPDAVHSSHSIYFQALGEHGWIGFALYMTFLLVFWRNCSRLIRLSPDTADGRADKAMAKMLQVSLIGFMIGGAFVNIGNWDAIYYSFIIVLALNRIREADAKLALTTARLAKRRVSLNHQQHGAVT